MNSVIDQTWSRRYSSSERIEERINWTKSKTVVEHIAKQICGVRCSSLKEAKINLIRDISKNIPYKRGISIACGLAENEMDLLERGIVSYFDCYELSNEAICKGQERAIARKLEDKICFHHKNIFEETVDKHSYDFIYWDNAMHHMLDVYCAMELSKNLIAKQGCFFMFDYVGPSRFQWSDEQISIVKGLLSSIDDKYFLIPNTEYMWNKEPNRSTIEEMIKADPSEAADSENIIPAFKKIFPSGKVKTLGGLIYVLGLDGIIINIPEKSILLEKLLKIDEILSSKGHNYFSVAYFVS